MVQVFRKGECHSGNRGGSSQESSGVKITGKSFPHLHSFNVQQKCVVPNLTIRSSSPGGGSFTNQFFLVVHLSPHPSLVGGPTKAYRCPNFHAGLRRSRSVSNVNEVWRGGDHFYYINLISRRIEKGTTKFDLCETEVGQKNASREKEVP